MDPTQQPIFPPLTSMSNGNPPVAPQLNPAAAAAAAAMQPPQQHINPLVNMGLQMPASLPTMPPQPPGFTAPSFPPHTLINDPILLGQLTGFPGELLVNSPSMMASAQQFLAQRMMMQQQSLLLSNQQGIAPVQGLLHPQQMQMMQQQRLQAQRANTSKTTSKPTSNKGKGSKSKKTTKNTAGRGGGTGAAPTSGDGSAPDAPAGNTTNTTSNQALPGVVPAIKEDPGGDVIWAKLANSPWWPAKTMDRSKDRSFPLDADPPRPTAIPIRFFGTHEFAWMGSKRAVVDWEKGMSQGYDKISEERETDNFICGLQEAETYLKEKTLPDVFYILPHAVQQLGGGGGARKGRGTKRGASGGSSGGTASKMFAATGFLNGQEYPTAAMANIVGGGGSGGPRHKEPELTVEERAQLVFARKQRRLYEWGLLPPAESPFSNGLVAENSALLDKLEEWEAKAPELMQKAKKEVEETYSKPPRASVYQPPPPAAAGQPDASAITAMQNQNAAYMMGVMQMNQHGLSLAAFV